ncbi:MAG: hypothetical protein H7A21_13810 [Spirochaetales bacterium]|nr:hypothetical protein [Spirochaetales bacterium]
MFKDWLLGSTRPPNIAVALVIAVAIAARSSIRTERSPVVVFTFREFPSAVRAIPTPAIRRPIPVSAEAIPVIVKNEPVATIGVFTADRNCASTGFALSFT